MTFLAGYKTYIAATVGIVSMLGDLALHGPNPTNIMGLISGFGAIFGRAVAKP